LTGTSIGGRYIGSAGQNNFIRENNKPSPNNGGAPISIEIDDEPLDYFSYKGSRQEITRALHNELD